MFKQLFFFCVSTPTVLSLNVDSFLSQHCSGSLHCYHRVSVSEYNVLLDLLLSLCINSWKSFQFTWYFFSSSFKGAQQYSITNRYHKLYNHCPIEGHSLIFQFFATTKSMPINILEQVIFLMITLGYKPSSGMAGSKGRQSFIAL